MTHSLRFSIRTLMLAMLGGSILCALFTTGGWDPNFGHLLLVLAFAMPAGSWAFDVYGTERAAAWGTCAGAIFGTVCVSVLALTVDLIWLFG